MSYHQVVARHHDTGLEALLAVEHRDDEDFRAEWLRLAPARQFAAMLVGYRADHNLSQRQLGQVLGVSQPRVARMESGEQNPDFETIVAVVALLGTEFCLDVAPAGADARLVTRGASRIGSVVSHGGVSVVTASARPRRLVRA